MKILDVPQSGSQAGTTSSRNRFGQYRRTRATPVNPNSTRQSLVRSRLSSLSEAWRGLTTGQRDAWDAIAAGLPLTDSLGQTVFPTGHQRFVGTNLFRLNVGLATIGNAPPLPAPTATPSYTFSAGQGGLAVAFTGATVGEIASVFASGPRSAGRQFEGDYRWMVSATAAAASGSIPMNAAWITKFGNNAPGQKIFVKVLRATGTGLVLSETVLSGVVFEE
jgi:hypothetical protein